MGEHYHTVYVRETIDRAVDVLKERGIAVAFKPKKGDPDYANALFSDDDRCGISSCVRWRKSAGSAAKNIPAQAMACLELLTSAHCFDKLLAAAEKNLTVVGGCPACGQ